MSIYTDKASRTLKLQKAEKPKIGHGLPPSMDGFEGENRIQMVNGKPRLYYRTNNAWYFTGLSQDGTTPDIPTATSTRLGLIKIGSGGTVSSDGTYTATAATPAADDITGGDAAVTISTSSGNITIDAAANNSDVIFKGTDASSDITMLTLDGSDAGHAIFNSSITVGALLIMPDVTNHKILVSDRTSYQEVALSGDATIANTGAITLAAAQTNITSIYATDLIIGEDSQTAIDFGTANEIDFKINNSTELTLDASALYPVTDAGLDLGTSTLEFKDAFFDGTVTSDAFAGPLTGNVTGNVSGNLTGTVLTATQGTIDHDSLANFVTNEHINWVNASAGTIHASNYTNTVDMGDGFKLADADSNHDVTEGHYVKFITQQGTAGTGVITGDGGSGNPWVVTLNAPDTNTVDMGDGFVLEDGDGTELAITENKEVKFIESTGIDIDWTDTSHGTDGDPYDLTFTLTGNLPTLSGLANNDGNFIVANGSAFTVESGATARTSLGLGSAAVRADTYFKASDDVETPALGGTGVTSTTAYKNVLDDETWTFANTVTVPALTTSALLTVSFNGGGNAIAVFEDTAANANILIKATVANKNSIINFGDAGSTEIGQIDYDHADNSMVFVTNAGQALELAADNTANFAADVVAYASSDPILKENKELINNPLDKISKIGGYSFDWKKSAKEYGEHLKGHDYGIMADEIEALFPELVNTRSNGIRAVKYDKLVPLLIEGIKELKQQLDTIK